MKTSSLFFALLLFVLPQASLYAAAGGEVESAIVDSITANAWRTESENALVSFRIKTTSRMVDGDGDVKHEDITWQLVELEPNGGRTIYKTDEFGEKLPDELPEVHEADKQNGSEVNDEDGEKEVSVSIGPIDPFLEENRGNHRFILLPDPAPGQIAIKSETIDPDKGGFDATYIFDTTNWTPVSVSGHPVPMPDKKVKEMDMTIRYQPYGDGYAFPKTVSSDVTAKWLLFTFRAHMEQEFFNMVARESGE